MIRSPRRRHIASEIEDTLDHRTDQPDLCIRIARLALAMPIDPRVGLTRREDVILKKVIVVHYRRGEKRVMI